MPDRGSLEDQFFASKIYNFVENLSAIMKDISLEIKLPENQLSFFLQLVERLQFIEVERVDGQKRSKAELLASLHQSLLEVEMHRQGKIKLPTIEEVLHEL